MKSRRRYLSTGAESPSSFDTAPDGPARGPLRRIDSSSSKKSMGIYRHGLKMHDVNRIHSKLSESIDALRQLRENLDRCAVCSGKFTSWFRPSRECMVCLQLVCKQCSQQRWPKNRIPVQNLKDKAKKKTYRVCATCTTDPKRLERALREQNQEIVMATYCRNTRSDDVAANNARRVRENRNALYDKTARSEEMSSTTELFEKRIVDVYEGSRSQHNRRSSLEKGKISWSYYPTFRPKAIEQKLMNYYDRVVDDENEVSSSDGTMADRSASAIESTQSEKTLVRKLVRKLEFTVKAAQFRREHRSESVFLQSTRTPVEASMGLTFHPGCVPSTELSGQDEAEKEDVDDEVEKESVDDDEKETAHAHDVLLTKKRLSSAINMLRLNSMLTSAKKEEEDGLLMEDGLESSPACPRKSSMRSNLRHYYGRREVARQGERHLSFGVC